MSTATTVTISASATSTVAPRRTAARALAGTSLLGLAVLAAACGPQDQASCVYLDVERSTEQMRPAYLADFDEQLESVRQSGGALRVVVGTGRPLTESSVLRADFAGLDTLERASEAEEEADALRDEVDAFIASVDEGTGSRSKGSAIAAGLTLLANDGRCGAVTAFTDGLETVDFDVYRDEITSSTGRASVSSDLEQAGKLPELSGATVAFPYGGIVPQGSDLSEQRKAALPATWAAVAERAGGQTAWGS